MPDAPEVQEPPSPMTDLAKQMKEQTDKALGLDDQSARLDAEFRKAGWTGTGELPRENLSPATPIAVTPGEVRPEAAPAATPEPAKSKIPASLLKKAPATPAAAKSGADEIDESLQKLLNGVDTLGARERIQNLYSDLKEAKRRIREEYEPSRDTHKATIKSYEDEIAKLKSAPPVTAPNDEFEKLKKERDDLDAILKQTDIERHPQFKAAFDDKISQKITKLNEFVGNDHKSALSLILDQPDSKAASEAYEKLAEEIGGFKANQLLVMTQSLRDLRSERARELENWKANSEQVAKVEKTKAIEAEKLRAGELDLTLKKTLAEITDENSPLYVFRQVEGETEWNQGVQKRLEEVKRIATKSLTVADQVELAKRAVAADGAYELLADAMAQVTALSTELDAIKKATPGFRGGAGSNEVKDDPNESYADRITRLAAQSGAFNR